MLRTATFRREIKFIIEFDGSRSQLAVDAEEFSLPPRFNLFYREILDLRSFYRTH